MIQHLKSCRQRRKDIAVRDAESTKQKTKLFSLLIEGRYNPQYWMHIELPATEPLDTLDVFLRNIWVECCEHLSAFRIDGTSYESETEDIPFYEIYDDSDEEEVEEEESGSLEEEDASDEENVSSEEEDDTEAAEETVAHLQELFASIPAEYREAIASTLFSNINSEWSNYEFIAFIKEKQKALNESGIRSMVEGKKDFLLQIYQRQVLSTLLYMLEDTSLQVHLENVLKVGQAFTYDYDFGSTTHLSLKVMAEREGVVADENEPVEILARNNPPVIPCIVCGKLATKVEGGYDFNMEQHAYCDEHAQKAADVEMMLPIVNSPRVGICGYTGDAEYEEDEWEEDDEGEEEE